MAVSMKVRITIPTMKSSTVNDDPVNGVDDDDDNNVDEDPASDNNGDGCPGVCGVDDDGDGQIDEGHLMMTTRTAVRSTTRMTRWCSTSTTAP